MNTAPILPVLPGQPVQPASDDINRLVLVRELIETMTRLTGPRELYPTPFPPDPEQTLQQPAELAIQAAKSAETIAVNVAALGSEDGKDADRTQQIWDATLDQITRIQALYKLPKLPFSKKNLPWLGDNPGP